MQAPIRLLCSRSKIVCVLVLVLAVVSSVHVSPVYGQGSVAFSFFLNESSLVSCWYWGVMFNAEPGQLFTVKWNGTAIIPASLDLYIVPQKSTQETWFCDNGPVSLYSRSAMFGSGSWAASTAGEYVVLLVNNNFNPGSSVSGTLSLASINGNVMASPIGYATASQPSQMNGGGQ